MKKFYSAGTLGIVFLLISGYYLINQDAKPSLTPTDSKANWVKELIEKEKNNPVANPPASLVKCDYMNRSVYYLPPRCCDIPSLVYDEKGSVICSPDGGFTGSGDGRCANFFEKRENCVVVWEDSRSI